MKSANKKASAKKTIAIDGKVAAAAPAAPKATDTQLGPNEKYPFGIKITNPGGNVSWERFKTAKERDSRLPQKGAEAVNFAPAAPAATSPGAKLLQSIAKGKPAIAAIPAPAAKPAKGAAKPAAKPAAPAKDVLAIHVNKTGRVCFAKDAAARLAEFFGESKQRYCLLAIDKGIVRLEPSKKDIEGALPVRDASGRPYISATKQFKPLGFDGSRPYAIEARPYGAAGFEFRLA